MKDFSVKSTSGELLVAFTNECKKLGWKRNSNFNDSKISDATIHGGSRTCIHFSNNWHYLRGVPQFAPHNPGDSKCFMLPEQWNEALQYALGFLRANENKTVRLTADYNAIIDKANKVVKVGCQEIPFAKVLEIAEYCK